MSVLCIWGIARLLGITAEDLEEKAKEKKAKIYRKECLTKQIAKYNDGEVNKNFSY